MLDLFVAWCNDPDLKISLSRNVNSYKPRSRYNALNISKITPKIVDVLIDADLVDQAKGFLDRASGIGRDSRIWPTSRLVKMFQNAKFGIFDVTTHPNKECIELRDDEKRPIEYSDTEDTEKMRASLTDYNNLLNLTFIDIPTLEESFIDLGGDGKGGINRLYVNQNDKFVRRIFNRGSWELGGRYYGGWWQRCSKEWREQIFMDDKPISELDFSGLHIVLLYAQAGIDYWAKNPDGDPYAIDAPKFVNPGDKMTMGMVG